MQTNNKIIKEQLQYQALKESYEEACSYIHDLEEHIQTSDAEQKYLEDYIRFMHLDDDYQFFRENAVLDPSKEDPFPYYILLS